MQQTKIYVCINLPFGFTSTKLLLIWLVKWIFKHTKLFPYSHCTVFNYSVLEHCVCRHGWLRVRVCMYWNQSQRINDSVITSETFIFFLSSQMRFERAGSDLALCQSIPDLFESFIWCERLCFLGETNLGTSYILECANAVILALHQFKITTNKMMSLMRDYVFFSLYCL